MKLLFVHDFPAEFYKGDYYSMGFPYSIWERYLSIFDEMIISSRFKSSKDIIEKKQSSGKKVEFRPITSYKSPKSLLNNHKDIIEKITLAIKESDGVLIRVPSVLGFIAAKICKQLNKKYMVEVVGSAYDAFWYHGSIFGKLLAYPIELLQKQAVKNATVAIYVTQNYLSNKYPCNGKEFPGISNVQDIAISSKDLSINKKVNVGLIGSTFVDYKGHETAIKAANLSKNKGVPIQLEFVGEGPSPKFTNMAKKFNLENDVIFKGKIYGKEKLNKWFNHLDIYIQPSLTEGHCRSIVEAIGNGVPTLASNAGGNSDSVVNEYLFDAKDYKKLSELIEALFKDKNLRRNNVIQNQDKISIYNKEQLQTQREEALTYYKNVIINE